MSTGHGPHSTGLLLGPTCQVSFVIFVVTFSWSLLRLPCFRWGLQESLPVPVKQFGWVAARLHDHLMVITMIVMVTVIVNLSARLHDHLMVIAMMVMVMVIMNLSARIDSITIQPHNYQQKEQQRKLDLRNIIAATW